MTIRAHKRLLTLLGVSVLAFAPAAAEAAWAKAQTRHFTIYSESSEDKLRAFAEKLEKFDGLLREVTGIEDPEQGSPVHVYLVDSDQTVMRLARNRNARGMYETSDRFAYAVLSRDPKASAFDLGAQEILFHEYTHHFMLHHFPAAYPEWYVEGFAEFFSTIKFPKDGSIQFGNVPVYRAPGLVYGSPYPLKQLLARAPGKMSAQDGDRYYGTAWLLTHYFQYRPDRRKEIASYLSDVAKGVPDMKLDSYFAGGIEGLERDLHSYMRKPLTGSLWSPKGKALGEISIHPVDPVRGALIEDELRLIGELKPEEMPGLISSIRQTVARYPGNAYALTVLAEAEVRAEQRESAIEHADKAIAIDPGLSRAHSARARMLLDRAKDSGKAEDWTAARSAIVKANRADTEDPVPLELYYRYYVMKGAEVPEVGIDGLYKAFHLLPQHYDYRLTLASALARRGEYEKASRLLNPIAYSPHASEAREAALKLKTEFDAAAARDPAPVKRTASTAP